MAKSDKQVIREEVLKLQKLMSWQEYYQAMENPIEINKVKKELEDQQRKVTQLRKNLKLSERK